MIFPDRSEELFNKPHPCKRAALFQVVLFRIMCEGFKLKGIVAVCNVVALSVHPADEVKEQITKPVKNKQHLYLLPEVYLFMPDELSLIVGLAGYPNENEK